MDPRNSPKSSWRIRRRFMFMVSVLCAWAIVYSIAWVPEPTTVHETAVTMAFLTLGGIVGSYVFGAAWEDISRNAQEPSRRERSSRTKSDDLPSPKPGE